MQNIIYYAFFKRIVQIVLLLQQTIGLLTHQQGILILTGVLQ